MLRKHIPILFILLAFLTLTKGAEASPLAPPTLSLVSYGQPQGGHDGYCILSWTGGAGADHYTVYSCDANGGSPLRASQQLYGTTDSFYCDASTTTYYFIVAEDRAEYDPSPPSNIVGARLPTPPRPSLSVIGYGQPQGGHDGYCILSWTGVAGADHYSVYSCDANGGSPLRASQQLNGKTASFYCDAGSYSHYIVFAEDRAETHPSPPSNVVSARLGILPKPAQNNVDPTDAPCPDCGNTSPSGPAAHDPVNLANGMESYEPTPDITVYNPSGPAVVFARNFGSERAKWGQSSPGLSAGWGHNYDVSVQGPQTPGVWDTLTLDDSNGAQEILTPVLDVSGQPTGAFSVPAGSSYIVTGVPSGTVGQWQSLTLTWKDRSQWFLTPGFEGYVLSRITNPMGKSLALSWIGSRQLNTITDVSTGTVLLTLFYDSDGDLSKIVDAYGRQVVYTFDIPNGLPDNCLLVVSQVASSATPNPAFRWKFSYTPFAGEPLLSSITVPSPTGTGMAQSHIYYDLTGSNPTGKVLSIKDGNGNQRIYTYGVNSTLVQAEDKNGNILRSWTQNFDSSQRDTGVTFYKPDGTTVLYQTQSAYGDSSNPNKPTSVTDKNGHITQYVWDNGGSLVQTTSPRGTITNYTWAFPVTPPVGLNHVYKSDAPTLGELQSVQEGSKTATGYHYKEPSGLVTEVDSPTPWSGVAPASPTVATRFTYDDDEGGLGNLRTVTTPGNGTVSTKTTTYEFLNDATYQADGTPGSYTTAAQWGQPLTITDSEGKVTHLRYDVQGHLVIAIDPAGNRTDSNYIEAGQTASLADQIQSVQSPATGQNGSGRSSMHYAYQYPDGPLSSVTSDDEGNVGAIRKVVYEYGPEGETLQVSGSTEPVTYVYDALYRLQSLTDANNHTTHYYYRYDGSLDSVTYPGYTGPASPNIGGPDSVRYPAYDPAGNVLQRVDGNGAVTNYVYNDPESLLTDVQYPAAPALNVRLTYDGYGRPATLTDSVSGKFNTDGTVATPGVVSTYDDTDGLISRQTTYNNSGTLLPSKTLSYTYNPDGSRAGTTTPGGAFAYGYGYDGLGRLNSLTNPSGEASSWAYPIPLPTDKSWKVSQTLNNGVTTTATYNPLGHLTDLLNKTSGGTLSEFSVPSVNGYDGAGNRLTLTAALPGYSGTTSYTYDYGQITNPRLNRSRLTQETTTRGAGVGGAFAYDAAGSPTVLRGVASGPWNVDNQPTGLGFDGNGNPAGADGMTLAFDPENHLVSASAQSSRKPTTVAVGGDGITRLLWQGADGSATVTALTAAGAVASSSTYGPFSGWTPKALAAGPNGAPRLLWTNADGHASLWNLADTDPSATCHIYGPYDGWTATALTVGSDNAPSLLWDNADGRVSLWNVYANGNFDYQLDGPYDGWRGTAIGIGPDNHEHLLWDNVSGQVSLWNFSDPNPAAGSLLYGPFPGLTATALAVGPDNAVRLLWESANGQAAVWNMTASDPAATGFVGSLPFGWSGTSLAFGPDAVARLLWGNGDGQALIWDIAADATYTALPTLAPPTVASTGATFGYSADGLRAWKETGAGVRTYYLYDGTDPVCELDGTGAVTAVNTFGAQGLLSRHVTASNTSTFYTFDERGNVAQRTDGTGAVLSTDLYDAYGKLLAGGAAGDPWGFEAQAGYYTDAETGLILCTHRYYDPQTGRFLTRDPIGYAGGIDLYGYVGDDPVNFIDPFGYDAWALGLRLALGAEALGGGPEDPAADVVAGVILGVAGGVVLYDHLTHNAGVSNTSKPYCPNRDLPKKAPGTSDDGKPIRDKDADGNPIEGPHTQLGRLHNGDPQAREWPAKPQKGRDVPVRDIHWSDHGTPQYHPDVPHQREYDPKTGQKGPNKPFP